MKNNHMQNGFSLIEVMVVIAVISILSAVAIPNFLGYVPNWRLKNAATDLYGNFQLARATAIKEKSTCTVTFSQDPDRYTMSCNGRTVALSDYKSGVRFDNLGVEEIAFLPNGIANISPVGPGDIELTNSGQTRHYEVSAIISGVIRLKKL